ELYNLGESHNLGSGGKGFKPKLAGGQEVQSPQEGMKGGKNPNDSSPQQMVAEQKGGYSKLSGGTKEKNNPTSPENQESGKEQESEKIKTGSGKRGRRK